MEESVRWELDLPPAAAQGHGMLQDLSGKLEKRERELRGVAFEQAHRFVDHSAELGGIPTDGRYPARKSYPQPPRPDARRVDVEIHAGKAFVRDAAGAAP